MVLDLMLDWLAVGLEERATRFFVFEVGVGDFLGTASPTAQLARRPHSYNLIIPLS
jgi:hypothetical protein